MLLCDPERAMNELWEHHTVETCRDQSRNPDINPMAEHAGNIKVLQDNNSTTMTTLICTYYEARNHLA